MDFDGFDAPQFVDFSQPDFEESQEGDSWFSDSDDRNLEMQEAFICVPEELVNAAAPLSTTVALPSWAQSGQSPPVVPPDPLHAHSGSILMHSPAKPPMASTGSKTSSISRWRQAVKRASLEQQRRQSLSKAKAKRRSKEKILTPTKDKRQEDEFMAKRQKTDEKAKRPKANTGHGVPHYLPPRPMITVLNVTFGPEGSATSEASNTVPAHCGQNGAPPIPARKRSRDVEARPEPKVGAEFILKTAVGKKTFNFAAQRQGTEEETAARRFHARPAPPGDGAAFRPKLGRRRRTEFKEFHFRTEERAKDRIELNSIKAQNQARLYEMEEKRREAEAVRERLEIRQLREKLVHKATPVHFGRPFIIASSSKKLTNPESPNLSYKTSKRES